MSGRRGLRRTVTARRSTSSSSRLRSRCISSAVWDYRSSTRHPLETPRTTTGSLESRIRCIGWRRVWCRIRGGTMIFSTIPRVR
eukprot:6337222-Lingulodinium_polyedra.AAC.1